MNKLLRILKINTMKQYYCFYNKFIIFFENAFTVFLNKDKEGFCSKLKKRGSEGGNVL